MSEAALSDRKSLQDRERALDAAASRCVYVGDNVAKDFVAPRRLGWKTVRIRRGDGLYEDSAVAENGHPDVTVASLDELDGALERGAVAQPDPILRISRP